MESSVRGAEMKVYPKNYNLDRDRAKQPKPLEVNTAERNILVAKANELLGDAPMEFNVLLSHLEHWCVYGKDPIDGMTDGCFTPADGYMSKHYTQKQLRKIIRQVQRDNSSTLKTSDVQVTDNRG